MKNWFVNRWLTKKKKIGKLLTPVKICNDLCGLVFPSQIWEKINEYSQDVPWCARRECEDWRRGEDLGLTPWQERDPKKHQESEKGNSKSLKVRDVSQIHILKNKILFLPKLSPSISLRLWLCLIPGIQGIIIKDRRRAVRRILARWERNWAAA